MTTALDITVVQGNNIKLIFTVRNKAGIPVDITGYYIKWQIRKSNRTEPFGIKTTSEDTITIIDAPNGRFQIILGTFDTVVAPGDYIYEAIAVDPSGNAVTLRDFNLQPGKFTILERFTNLFMIMASHGRYHTIGYQAAFTPAPPTAILPPISDNGTQHPHGLWNGFGMGMGN